MNKGKWLGAFACVFQPLRWNFVPSTFCCPFSRSQPHSKLLFKKKKNNKKMRWFPIKIWFLFLLGDGFFEFFMGWKWWKSAFSCWNQPTNGWGESHRSGLVPKRRPSRSPSVSWPCVFIPTKTSTARSSKREGERWNRGSLNCYRFGGGMNKQKSTNLWHGDFFRILMQV